MVLNYIIFSLGAPEVSYSIILNDKLIKGTLHGHLRIKVVLNLCIIAEKSEKLAGIPPPLQNKQNHDDWVT